MKQSLARWLMKEYISAAIRGLGGDYMAPGSENAMVTGENFIRAFRGVETEAGKVGSRLYFNTAQEYAGLGTATNNGTGSVFLARELLSYIGNGEVAFKGALLPGIVANDILTFIKQTGGDFIPGPTTGPFQAGHGQPSAPIIYPKSNPSAGQSLMDGTVAVKIWRVSDITGQVSLASLPSNVLTLTAQSVIVQFPLADFNGQTHWGIGVPKIGFDIYGVFYELPINLQGEVAESVLAYQRTVTGASIADTTNIVDVTDPDTVDQFTSADIGRQISFGAFTSWITAINSPTQAVVSGTNTSGSAISGTATVVHAVEGITRAIEISWTNGALIQQALVPERAFPPSPGQFAGAANDVWWVDSDGIIYVGEPGQVGSFPPSNAIFANERAVAYLPGGDGLTFRFGKHSMGVMSYVGGSPALEYQEIWRDLGISYPQNAARGYGGRLLLWLGRPAVVQGSLEPDYNYANKVVEFADWDAQQSEATPICIGYDGRGEYEVWCLKKKVMSLFVPKHAWCAPIDLTDKVSGDIVAVTTYRKQLYLTTSNGAALTRYKFDAGTGSVMKVQTSDQTPNGYGATITELLTQGRVDNLTNKIKIEIVSNYDDANPILLYECLPPRLGPQVFIPVEEPNIIDSREHSLRLTLTSAGGDAGWDYAETKGETNEVRIPA